ncbi:unnamed protein product [Lactuca saligna]|uniref:Inositol-tetrakisphosphate 1-kinase n=1 Tax=Lactuca saligna TaxID=75948 RepID=A0AA35UWF8_LACSI|nr:unnamed protein product [Lactuca saligna]
MAEFETKGNLFHVGYALPARKIKAFMVPSFIDIARERGIDFIPIDVSKPLTDQAPFDCILHKVYGNEWNLNLQNFSVSNPNATIIDPLSAIQRLHNRISMLEPVSQLNIPQLKIPNQILVRDAESLKNVETTSGLNFPVIAKSLLADGTTKAHDMSLVFNHDGLMKEIKLEPPMVLQQFVNHGGTIFKVYVADDYVKCVKRSSLPDLSKDTIDKIASDSGGAISFSRISGAVIADGRSDNNSGEELKMPATEFLVEVAKGLRKALGLHLFNFDMIRDGEGDGYLESEKMTKNEIE